MDEIPHEKLTVDVGDQSCEFAIGDFLTALDAVTKYFQSERETRDEDLVAALRMYADHVEAKE